MAPEAMLRSGTVANLSHLAVVLMAQLVVLVGGVPSAAGDPKPRAVHHAPRVVQTTTTTPPATTTTEPPTTLPPETTTTTAPPPVAPAPQADSLGIAAAFQALGASTSEAETFVCIVQRESRFDPNAVNPSSGAGGALQFLPSTWYAVSGLPGGAQDYPIEVQIQYGWKLYQDQGFAPWGGGCV